MRRKVLKALLSPNPLSGTTSSLIFYLIWTSLEPCKSNQSGSRGCLFGIKGIINTSSAPFLRSYPRCKGWGFEVWGLNSRLKFEVKSPSPPPPPHSDCDFQTVECFLTAVQTPNFKQPKALKRLYRLQTSNLKRQKDNLEFRFQTLKLQSPAAYISRIPVSPIKP